MITYQVDRVAHQKLQSEIKDIAPVLAEIAPTLQTLQDIINKHATAVSTPTINSFRVSLQDLIGGASAMTRTIEEDVQKLVAVSDQASKHLAAIEDHFGTVLRSGAKEVVETTAAQQA